MTVGQPETNLDTWGLRYVKKKEKDVQHGVHTEADLERIGAPKKETTIQEPPDKPTRRTGEAPSSNITPSNRGQTSDADMSTPNAFRDRKEDSKGDKDVKVHRTSSGTDALGSPINTDNNTDKPSTSPQVHTPPTNVKPKKGEEGEGKYGVGSSVPAGSTQGSDETPKLTQQGKPQTEGGRAKNPEGLASGSDASHESGHQSIESRTGANRFGETVDPEKKTRQSKRGTPSGSKRSVASTTREAGDKPSGTVGTVAATDKPARTTREVGDKPKGTMPSQSGNPALPKNAAALDLAIIKCKLFKMKTDASFINSRSAGVGTEITAKKPKVEEHGDENTKYYSAYSDELLGVGAKGKKLMREEKEKTSPTFTEDEKSDMTKEDLTRKREASRQDAEDKGVGHIYKEGDVVDKAIELINMAYDEMNKTEDTTPIESKYEWHIANAKLRKRGVTHADYERQQKEADNIKSDGLSKFNPAVISDPKGKPFCANCGRDHKTEDKKTLEAVGITEEHGNPNQKQVMVSGTGGGNKPSCPSCGYRSTKKDAPASTGDVGAANFVYSDVAEAKKNEDFIDLDDPKNKEQAKIIRERLARANESIGISDKK